MTEIIEISEVLPEDDVRFLREKYPVHVVRHVGAEIHVLLKDFTFPPAYSQQKADLLLRLPAGYPNAAPDMFWTLPDIKLVSGKWPLNSDAHEVPGAGPGVEVYQNVAWQRWSRHFQGGWLVGRHGLQSYVAAVNQELKKGI